MVSFGIFFLAALASSIMSTLALPTNMLLVRSTPDPTASILVVMLKPGVRPTQGKVAPSAMDFSSVQARLDKYGASIHLMFGEDENSLLDQLSKDGMASDMASFYHVSGPSDKLDQLSDELMADDLVEAAYVKPGLDIPVMYQPTPEDFNNRRRDVTRNFTAMQDYLGPAPGGIEAVPYASGLLGGRGRGVNIIDVESAWRLTHEDLPENQGGLVGGQNKNDMRFINHGTAVAGILGGDKNDFGITGIVPDANFRASSDFGQTRPAAIKRAADMLNPGDIILLELQGWGPLSSNPPKGQQGMIPVEWWPDHYEAIRYAVRKGILVVEAAGNGHQDLDNPIYEKPLRGFPKSWKNPFNPANPQSGAVMVGAGAPPTGGDRSYYGTDRSRLSFSNYGRRLDVQSWGEAVVTAGYGDLQGGDQDSWYTKKFSGTSSASPIVTGALAVVQGVLLANRKQQLTPARAIKLLRSTGSPQQSYEDRTVSQRIGNRPNLRQLIAAALDGEPLPADDTAARAKL